MSQVKSISELWKERFAFVSGNVLVSATLLLNLWPALAAFQTDLHIHFWTINSPGEGVLPELWVFWFGTLILALASYAVILTVTYILCWGIWLGLSIGSIDTGALGLSLSRICDLSYRTIFLQSIYMGFMIILIPQILLIAVLEHFLVSSLSWSPTLSGWISRGIVIAILLGTYEFLRLKIASATITGKLVNLPGVFKSPQPLLALLPPILGWIIVIESCYTADIKINQQLFVQSRDDIVEVYITLGGGTSDERLAAVRLLDSKGDRVKDLAMENIGEGRYISYVVPTQVPRGRFNVILEYPHMTITGRSPFLSQTIRKSKWFLVVP